MTGKTNLDAASGTKPCRSDEQRVLDAIEDDEVRECLRRFHAVPACPRSAVETPGADDKTAGEGN